MSDRSSWHALSLVEARARLASGVLTARGLADAWLARVAATDARIEAWAHLDPARVRAAADRLDATPPAQRGPLHGIGIGVKDIIATADLPTEMGSPVHAGHRPAADAACVARVKAAGGYVFGKTVTTAYAFLDPGKTRNPWHPGHTPGGSSSGSAAAVAAGHVPGALGTQTNGSVIRPAAYCGVVGFKPTRGSIALDGIHVFSETLDQAGTFTRSVADAALLAHAVAAPGAVAGEVAAVSRPPRLAYLAQFPWTRLDCHDDDRVEAAVTRLRRRAEVVPVELTGEWRGADRIHRTIMLFEAARNMAGLQDRERARLSPKLNAALDEGRAIAAAGYEAALRGRERAIGELAQWMRGFDAVLAPPAPSAAPAGLDSTGDPGCCTLWSLLGFPALTLPVDWAGGGLPIGLQLAAPAGADDRLLAVARWCEVQLSFASRW
ncbi:MAG: amidase [Betaproteobacteria bacterium]|nr:amidase [Betaproteobacteria bacterium]MBK8689093.1 amidase [Betaproteobacteria bacterium]